MIATTKREEWTKDWTAIARDDRTGHYWHAVPSSHLPACNRCLSWMTDWSLINVCDPSRVGGKS